VATLLIVILGGVNDIMMMLLAFSAVFTLAVNIDIAFRIIRANFSMIGAYVAHIGIALFILGVIGSAGYSKQVEVNLEKNVPVTALGYEMVFTGYSPIENTNKYQFNISLKKDDKSFKVAPIMYISDYNNGLMREPAILSMFTKDIYVSPLGYEESDGSGLTTVNKPKEVLTITASIKPFINFVWTGVLIMVIGFVISVIRRLKESLK
jgi:cytochrome c-type biogenesis protein CcmF